MRADRRQWQWKCASKRIEADYEPLLMGILNVTPDSFSDGGNYDHPDAAVAHAMELVSEGADIIDVGGCSTRPGSEPIPLNVELDRVLPVITGIAAVSPVPISVDTFHPEVAEAALRAGACIVNDVKPFAGDREMAEVIKHEGAGLVITHNAMDSVPEPMSIDEGDMTDAVYGALRKSLAFADDFGLDEECLVIDPGLGFGKNTEQNLELVCATGRLAKLAPVLIGASRKRFIGTVCEEVDASGRDPGSHACALWAWINGAGVLRVHDVRGMRQTVKMWKALCSKDSR